VIVTGTSDVEVAAPEPVVEAEAIDATPEPEAPEIEEIEEIEVEAQDAPTPEPDPSPEPEGVVEDLTPDVAADAPDAETADPLLEAASEEPAPEVPVEVPEDASVAEPAAQEPSKDEPEDEGAPMFASRLRLGELLVACLPAAAWPARTPNQRRLRMMRPKKTPNRAPYLARANNPNQNQWLAVSLVFLG